MGDPAAKERVQDAQQTDDARARILAAAETVFAERGYAAAATREIAERAGIGKRMLFYYFPSKDAVYREVLERIVEGLVAIHEQTRTEPGPVGLADAVEAMTRFTAQNLNASKVWMREIMDGGPYLAELTRRYVAPLYATAGDSVARNMADGTFRGGDPMHVLVNVGGITLFYFLIAPMLRLMGNRDPLDPSAIAERAAAARQFVLYGVAGPTDRKSVV